MVCEKLKMWVETNQCESIRPNHSVGGNSDSIG
jgi:hypothetical protein